MCVGVFEEWRRQETEVGTSAKDNERNDEQQKKRNINHSKQKKDAYIYTYKEKCLYCIGWFFDLS